MRLSSTEQPAYISLIRRRSRLIVSRAPAPSGTYTDIDNKKPRCNDLTAGKLA